MADVYTKGLNRKGGVNNFRFENFKERVAQVDVDEGHRVMAEHEGAAMPLDGEAGSFLKDELYRCMELDISKPFIIFSKRLAPMCQSLAQVLHHRRDVTGVFVDTLTTKSSAVCWKSVLGLVGAFAK